MIEILNIDDDGFFPKVDFSFKNDGSSTALIWQFSIEVITSEIDIRPHLDFRYMMGSSKSVKSGMIVTSSNSLVIQATNNGWGLARASELLLVEPALGSLFPENKLRFNGNINCSETKEIFNLSLEDIDGEKFGNIHEQTMARAKDELERNLSAYLEWNGHMTAENGYPDGYLEKSYKKYKKEKRTEFRNKWFRIPASKKENGNKSDEDKSEQPVPLIPLADPKISWLCTDIRNRLHQGLNNIQWPGNSGDLYISPDQFIYEENVTQAGDLTPNITYCCVLDPETRSNQHAYAISRMIPAGKSEVFRLMVGATKSCRLKLRFSFSVDGLKDVESRPATIDIWNPINSDWEQRFGDGDKARQNMMGLQEKRQEKRSARMEQQLLKEQRWLEEKLADYPFMPTDN